jgi:hypothetical protein
MKRNVFGKRILHGQNNKFRLKYVCYAFAASLPKACRGYGHIPSRKRDAAPGPSNNMHFEH